ncbi:tumor necrosis factor receptor superfamily member 18 [Rousettus aegyptiacus]|uniref:TNF receptor superfamily member 18 n=1 Tax=Rousettus aegyptiacus TaxID=9407 RepID=A0A7J8KIK2_ROUAE|nr:tumor necrosis factor receptor superfamily member 18 [Rousettus aegyptiacus]KAF6508716.1 TNF receptor superfamily member 18 [Rousettus aegyptiacus]
MGTRGARAVLCGVALLCALGLGQRPPGDPSCGPGSVLRGAGNDARCCGPCASAQDCPEGACTCVRPEFHCGDPQCTACKHYTCLPGQWVRASGTFTFGFNCVDCAAGTFSRGHEGHCEPWSNCSQAGLRTVFPGNRTHDAVCGPLLPPPPAERHCPLSVALLAVAGCILVLAVAQLGLHIWQLRKQRVWLPEAQMLLEAPPAEDACSCQFPEEERGEQLAEDKGCGEQLAEDKGDLWV